MVRVGFEVERGLVLPKDSEVRIQNIGLMGERQLGIRLGASQQSAGPGDTFAGRLDAGIAEAMGAAGEAIAEADLLVRSLRHAQQVDPGFDAGGVLKAEFQLPASRYPRDFARFPDWPAQQRFATELLARLAAAPGVASATEGAREPPPVCCRRRRRAATAPSRSAGSTGFTR